MRRFASFALTAFFVAATPVAEADVLVPPVLQIIGNVTNSARPVANALVIALNLKNLATTQTFSASDGTFNLQSLPAGIYKVIAVKQGFAPAVATVVPNKPFERVKLAMENEKRAKKNADEIWQIRASLPTDILHEIDQVLEASSVSDYQLPRFKGEMVSMTGVSNQQSAAAFAQTSLGVQGRIGDNWQLGVHGNLHRIDDPSDEGTFGPPAAQSSVMSMEFRSSPSDSVRVASTKSFWRLRNDTPETAETDIRSHNIQWQHGAANVQVRYFAQENLFAATPNGSDLIELAGGTTLVQTRRSDLGLSLRVTQENVRDASESKLRTADVTTTGSFAFVPSLVLRYGLSSRLGLEGTELAPRAGVEWKATKATSFVSSATVKTFDSTRMVPLPSVVVWSDDARNLPRYAYSFGIVSGEDADTKLSAVATISEVDAPLRLVVADGYDQFWDGLYVDSGDIRRDLRISYRRDFAEKLAVDVSTTAGTATPSTGGPRKSYVSGDLQTIFFPTGTALMVSYREIEQPQPARAGYRSERVNVRMAQSLHLPVDLKVLLGLELVRAQNSPFLLDAIDPDGASKRYIGGLAVNF